MVSDRTPARLAPAYLIVGEDGYLRELYREEILSAALPPEARDFAVARFSVERSGLGEVLRQALSRPMLSPRQVLLIREWEELGEEDQQRLEEYLDDPAEFSILVFEAEAVDRRRRSVRLLEERAEVREASSPDDSGAQRAVEKYAGELGLQFAPRAVEELVYAVGNDLGQLRQEVGKLRALVGSGRECTPEDVAAVVTPARQFTVFELGHSLAEHQRDEALRLLGRLLQAGENPIGIVGLLSWLYRQLLVAQSLPAGTSVGKAVAVLRAPRSRVEDLVRQARRFERAQLTAGFRALRDADVVLKSSPPDAAAVLETLVVRLTEGGPDVGARG